MSLHSLGLNFQYGQTWMYSTSLQTAYILAHEPLGELVYVSLESNIQLAYTHATIIPQREGSTHSILVYTISYYNIMANINIVSYVSLLIIIEKYPMSVNIQYAQDPIV